MSKDAPTAQAFYGELLGWEVDEVPMGEQTYRLVKVKGAPIASIMHEPGLPAPSHWMAYLGCEDVDATVSKVEEHGGKCCVQPMDLPGVGRFAVVADRQGA